MIRSSQSLNILLMLFLFRLLNSSLISIPDEATVKIPLNSLVETDTFFVANGGSLIIQDELCIGNAVVAGPGNFIIYGGIITVPQDFPTIQDAIFAASNGDTILVQSGTYYENVNYNGKSIILGSYYLTTHDTSYISQTIIDGNQNGSVVTFENNEDSTSVLCGFTLQNGNAANGGGVKINNADPIINNCKIINNSAYYSGGIYCQSGTIKIESCFLWNNVSDNYDGLGGGIRLSANTHAVIENCVLDGNVSRLGGGIYCHTSSAEIANTVIQNNHSTAHGGAITCTDNSSISLSNVVCKYNSSDDIAGGIYCHDHSVLSMDKCQITENSSLDYGTAVYLNLASELIMYNVTMCNNYAANYGGGVFSNLGSLIESINSIIWNNIPDNIYFSPSNSPNDLSISYTDIEGGFGGILYNSNGTINWLDGNIMQEPCFVDTSTGDFHLLDSSPCIDAGHPDPEYRDPDGSRSDMGAYYYHQSQFYQEALSLELNGVLDHVALQNPVPENPWNTLTVEAWINKPDYSPTTQCIMTSLNQNWMVGDWSLQVFAGGTASFYVIEPNLDAVSTTTVVGSGWHHLAGVADGSELKIYVDGILENTVAGITTMSSAHSTWIGGRNSAENRFFDGSIDEVRVWNCARTEAEIQQYMHSKLSGSEPGLEGYWPFDEGIGTTAYDYTIQANHGAIDGAVWNTDVPDFGLQAQFLCDCVSGAFPMLVNFTDTSTPCESVLSWQWDFDNDGTIDSNQQNPSYTYAAPGVYTVSLTVSDADSTSTVIKTDLITVENLCPIVQTPLGTLTMEEDVPDSTSVNLYNHFYDGNGDELSFVYSGNEHIAVDIQLTGDVVFSPAENWFGEETIYFTASDPWSNDAAGRGTMQKVKKGKTVNRGTWEQKSRNKTDGKRNESCIVTDVSVSDSLMITVTPVNDAPWFTSTPLTQIMENNVYQYTVTAEDIENDPLTFEAQQLPDWASFIPDLGMLVGLPTNADVGDHQVVLTLTDGSIPSPILQSFTITVQNVNDPPVITFPSEFVLYEDSLAVYDFSVYVSDPDNTLDDLTLSWDGNANIGIQQNNWAVTFSSPVPEWSGEEVVTFYVDDGVTRTRRVMQNSAECVHGRFYPVVRDIVSEAIDVRCLAVNDPPVLLSWIPEELEFTMMQDSTVSFEVHATDVDSELEYVWIADNVVLTEETDSVLVYPFVDVGITHIKAKVCDEDAFVTKEWLVHVDESVSSPANVVPVISYLHQNYPNPFNPVTAIAFDIKKGACGQLAIYNIKGQLVTTAQFAEGHHVYRWDGSDAGSGLYFYRLRAGEYECIRKMVLLK